MKGFLLFLISIIQTTLGVLIVSRFIEFGNGGKLMLGLVLFLLFVLFLLGVLVSYVIRKYEVILPIILEIILSPLAVFRFILGGIIAMALGQSFEIECSEDNVLGAIAGYLLYLEISEKKALSRGGNFISMTLFILPVTFIMFYSIFSDMYLCDWAKANYDISLPRINVVFGVLIDLFLCGALCVLRSQTVEYESYNANYKFENIYTGKKEKRYSSDYYLSLTDKASQAGWKKTSGGYESHFTIEMIATIILSPFLFFSYLLGYVANIVSFFVPYIKPCIGQVDYDEIPLGILQKPLHFLCAFVIITDVEKKEKREKRKDKNSYSSYSKSGYSYKKKKKSFKEILASIGIALIWPFFKIWEGIKNLIRAIRRKCDSFWEFLGLVGKVIFFPFILLYKGIKAAVSYIGEHCDSIGGILLIIGQILIFPIILIIKLIQAIRDCDLSDEFKATVIITFFCALGCFGFYILGRTGFIEKLTFDLTSDGMPDFLQKFFFTKLFAGKIRNAGLIKFLICTVLTVASAIIEAAIFVIGFILFLIIFLLLAVIQLIYVFALPVAIAIFALFVLLKNIADTESIGKILGLIFVAFCVVFVVLYFKELAPMLSAK